MIIRGQKKRIGWTFRVLWECKFWIQLLWISIDVNIYYFGCNDAIQFCYNRILSQSNFVAIQLMSILLQCKFWIQLLWIAKVQPFRWRLINPADAMNECRWKKTRMDRWKEQRESQNWSLKLWTLMNCAHKADVIFLSGTKLWPRENDLDGWENSRAFLKIITWQGTAWKNWQLKPKSKCNQNMNRVVEHENYFRK